MAIDIAKGIATQVVNNQLRKVAGNLPGLLGINKGKIGINSSDTAPLNQKSQNSPNLFQFPLDVAGDVGVGNHGHYIILFINESNKPSACSPTAFEFPSGDVKIFILFLLA